MNRARPVFWLLWGWLVLAPAAPAFALNYQPKEEESLSHIALVHYGDSKKLVYLVAANGIADPNKLLKGGTVWIPTVWKYRLKKGEDLAQVATRFLKDAKRADFLVWLNRINDVKDLKPGTEITIPFVLKYRVAAGQSMVDVAKRFYFSTRPAALLRKFNNQRTNALKAGELVFVPIYDPEAAIDKVNERVKTFKEQQEKAAKAALKLAANPTGEGPEGGEGPKEPNPLLADTTPAGDDPPKAPEKPYADARLVDEAASLAADGDFELAQASLNRVLEKGGLSKADEARARELLAVCLVALERPQEAEHEFVRLLMVDPDRALDPVTTSPKVLQLFQRAKGAR